MAEVRQVSVIWDMSVSTPMETQSPPVASQAAKTLSGPPQPKMHSVPD